MTPAKCPNPACPFLFDPSQVPPGAVIACPRCGMQFTLGPVPPYGQAAPPAAPDADLRLTEERPNTDDMPTEDRPMSRRRRGRDSREDDRDEDAPRRRPARSGSGSGKLILYSVAGVLLVCGVIAGVLFLKSRTRPQEGDGTERKREVVSDNYRIAFTPPDGSWEPDDELKRGLKASVTAMASKEPAGWIAVDARPMPYDPTAAELHDMARQALAANVEGLREELEEQDVTLAGVAAKRYLFDGTYLSARVAVKGEVYAVGYGKMAYLVYAFAPEKTVEEMNPAFAGFRAALRFLGRPSPKGNSGYRQVYRSKLGTYTVTAADPVWRELRDPGSRDGADLGLTGLVGPGGGSNPNTAEVLVFVRDKGVDLKARLTQQFDLPGNAPTLTEVTGDYQGDDPASGPPNPTAAVTRYEVRYPNGDASSRKFVVASTLEAGDKAVVAVGECNLRQRKVWEKRLVQLVGSLAAPE